MTGFLQKRTPDKDIWIWYILEDKGDKEMKRDGIAGVLLAAGIIMFCVLCFLFPYLNPVYDNQEGVVFYGIVENLDMNGSRRQVVNIPGRGQTEVPETEKITSRTLTEDFEELENGDLIKLVFPEDVSIMETWPAQFSEPADHIEVIARGPFALKQENGMCFLAFPEKMIAGTGADSLRPGIMLDFCRNGHGETSGEERFALLEIEGVNQEQNQIWVKLDIEQAKAFLEGYEAGVSCYVSERQDLSSTQKEDPVNVIQYAMDGNGRDLKAGDFVDGAVWDGIYTVRARSVSKNGKSVYVPVLDRTEILFSEDCLFVMEEPGDSGLYSVMSFEEFADLAEEKTDHEQTALFYAKFQDGEITEVFFPD